MSPRIHLTADAGLGHSGRFLLMAGLLDGMRVVEFSQLIAAPFCGLTLSDLGAEVVKVESPAGDPTRSFPPSMPEVGSAVFAALNRGKRGVVADLRDPAGRDLAARLIALADVVVENLGETVASLPVTPEGAIERNPHLVWCSITGRGRGVPGRAVDPSLQAAIGMADLTGERDGPPLRVPVPAIDFMTGMYAVQSVLTALWRLERGGTGAILDCAMVDAAATLTSLSWLWAEGGHLVPRRIGSESHILVPAGIFEAADERHVQVACITDRHWQGLCRALGLDDLLGDPALARNEGRLVQRELLHRRVGEAIRARPAADCAEAVAREGGICEPVRTVEEGWADPALKRRRAAAPAAGEALGAPSLPVISLAVAEAEELAAAPRLGEHTEEVREELQ